MTDIYIWLSILIVAVTGVAIYAIVNRKRQQPNLSLHAVPSRRHTRQPVYNPGVTIVETNSGFSEGMLEGAMYAQQRPAIIEDAIISDTVVIQDDPSAAAPFAGFSGGDSDGGGATSSWDSSTDSASCDASPADSSPCDSASPDSIGSSSDY